MSPTEETREETIRRLNAQADSLKARATPEPPEYGGAAVGYGYRIMAEAGALPEEVGLKAQLDAARVDWQRASDPDDKKRLMGRIADLQMRYEIARDARRKFMR